MKRIWFSNVEHSFNDIPLLVNQAREKNADEIVLLGETEWLAYLTSEDVALVENNNLKLRILHGCSKSQYYTDYYNQLGFDISNVEFWNTYWFNWGAACLLGSNIDYREYNPNPSEFTHSFISLNNRRHVHRCVFIDTLAKNNLLDKGVVTWTNFLNENPDYQFEYFHGNQILLNDDFINKLDSFLLPAEWHHSLFHVVTEANTESTFITEKTSIPILMKKPFIVFGCQGFHQALADLGFLLYDEVIDYSFDSEPDLKIRADKFTENILKISTLDKVATYELLKPKLMHNYNRAVEIIKSKEFIPNIILDRVAEILVSEKTLLVDSRFEMFLNDCCD